MSSHVPNVPLDDAALPSREVRTFVSFLIFVHLFAVGAALVFTPGMSSQLAQKFANLPVLRQYRQLLDMNLSYAYHLTFGGEELDFDHQIEVDLELADGERRQIVLPPAGLWPHTRTQRYRMLAFNTALNVGQDGIDALLPQGVSTGLLDQYGATRATFRCRVHLPLGRDRIEAGADPQAPDTWRTVYEATIWKTADGQIRLLKQESARDSAPGASPASDAAPAAAETPPFTAPPLDARQPAGAPVPGAPAPGRSGLNRSPLTFPPSR